MALSRRSSLREQYFGRWEGWTYADIAGAEQAAFDLWMSDIWNGRPPKGESFREVHSRVMEETQAILDQHFGHTIIVVAHVGSLSAITMNALGLNPEGIWRFRLAPASISVVQCYAECWVIEGLNDVCHLRELEA
jgi:broad specificity phosphatase PhoE